MPKPRFRLMLALTLDGFIADKNGGVEWLYPFGAEDTGFEAFYQGIGVIVSGRHSYDHALNYEPWPYAGKPVIVVTNRPFDAKTPDTEVWTGSIDALADKLEAEARGGDVWIMGGGALARSFLAAGRLDTLELAYVPVLLGEGIPLFGPGTVPASFTLLGTERFATGIVRLDYGRKHS